LFKFVEENQNLKPRRSVMHCSKNYLLVVFSAVALSLFCFATSFADVVYRAKASTSGFMGMGNMEMETISTLKGDKQKQETNTKFIGPTAQYMPKGGEQKQVTITRLDKELIWSINVLEKTYAQMTFDQVRKMMGKGMVEEEEAPEEEMEAKFKLDVKKSGQKKKIGGYDCDEFVITMVSEGKDAMSGEAQEFEVQTHLWISPDVKGYDQIENFQRKMAEKMGWEGMYAPGLTQALTQYGMETEELTKKLKEIKGFPMLTVIKVKTAGEETTEGEAEKEKSEQKEAMEKAMKMLGKKMKEAEEPEEKGVLYTMTTEVTDIQVKEVADSEFELPEGLKKQETPPEIK
jgi:hypothetical protein